MTKTAFDVIFIICAAIVLLIANEFGFLEKVIPVFLIPILVFTYYMGQYSERKFGNNKSTKEKK